LKQIPESKIGDPQSLSNPKKRTIHEMVQENFGNMPAIDRLQERYELNKLISKLKVVASKLKN